MDKDVELLDCPFCGGNATLHKVNGYTEDSAVYFVKCFKCDMGDRKTERKIVAIKRWNSRHPKQEGLVALNKEEVESALIKAHGEHYDGVMPHDARRIKEIYAPAICSRFGKVTLDEEKVRQLLWEHVVFESGDDYKLAKAIVSAYNSGGLT